MNSLNNCSNCKLSIVENNNYCPNCGNNLIKSISSSSTLPGSSLFSCIIDSHFGNFKIRVEGKDAEEVKMVMIIILEKISIPFKSESQWKIENRDIKNRVHIIQEIRNLLSKNQIDIAIECLKELCDNYFKEYSDELIIYSNILHEVKNKDRIGNISFQDKTQLKSKAVKSILDILNIVEKDLFPSKKFKQKNEVQQ